MDGTKNMFDYDCNVALLGVALGYDDAIKHGLIEGEHFNDSDREIFRNVTGDYSMIG